MSWIAFALLSGVFSALHEATVKQATSDGDEIVVAWKTTAIAGGILAAITTAQELPSVNRDTVLLLFASTALNAVALRLIFGGLYRADLSVATPLLGLSPGLVLLPAFVILGETPMPLNILGVLLVASGSYLLRLDARRDGLLGPFRALGRDEGPRMVLIAVLLMAVVAVLDKRGVQLTGAIFWSAAVLSGAALVLAPVALKQWWHMAPSYNRRPRTLVPVAGILHAATAIALMSAFDLGGPVALVIGLNRINGPVNVVIGCLWFREAQAGQKFIGSLIITAGVILVSVS